MTYERGDKANESKFGIANKKRPQLTPRTLLLLMDGDVHSSHEVLAVIRTEVTPEKAIREHLDSGRLEKSLEEMAESGYRIKLNDLRRQLSVANDWVAWDQEAGTVRLTEQGWAMLRSPTKSTASSVFFLIRKLFVEGKINLNITTVNGYVAPSPFTEKESSP